MAAIENVKRGNSVNNTIWLGYYGDDFTGSTDAMEALTTQGVRTVLFLHPPSLEMLNDPRLVGMEAFGIAGVSRSLAPEQMEAELRSAYIALKQSGARVCHYKVCSTFDSAPHVGSIGKAIEIAQEIFTEQRYVPLVVGVPALQRYTVFGQHYATMDRITYRLDRHPIMSRHPVTPMDEADIRKHLGKQTTNVIELIDVLDLAGDLSSIEATLERKLQDHPDIMLFDVLDEQMLAKVGEMLEREAARGQLFAAGSSGVEYALAAARRARGESASSSSDFSPVGAVDQMLVISGSCSPVTQRQIEFAAEQGFASIRVAADRLVDPLEREQACDELTHEASKHLSEGRSVILYSALGPNDPSISTIKARLKQTGYQQADSGKLLGEQMGTICKRIVRDHSLKRIVIAGGDTSGYVAKELGIYAMEMILPITPGAPLCKAYGDDPDMDGLQLSLKGGQMGQDDFFVRVKEGRPYIEQGHRDGGQDE